VCLVIPLCKWKISKHNNFKNGVTLQWDALLLAMVNQVTQIPTNGIDPMIVTIEFDTLLSASLSEANSKFWAWNAIKNICKEYKSTIAIVKIKVTNSDSKHKNKNGVVIMYNKQTEGEQTRYK
jgi:hypothetical protein